MKDPVRLRNILCYYLLITSRTKSSVQHTNTPHNFFSPRFNMRFVKGFEYIVLLIAAIIFLFTIMFITIRQIKKLPLSYAILIVDNQGDKIILPDLRLNF